MRRYLCYDYAVRKKHEQQQGSRIYPAALLHTKAGANDMSNPRYSNGNLRRKHRARLKAIGGPCGICHGRLGPIHYDEPSDSKHPLSFVIDEIKPISRYREFGYTSREAAAQDWNNLQAAHYCCNAEKSNKIIEKKQDVIPILQNISDGNW